MQINISLCLSNNSQSPRYELQFYICVRTYAGSAISGWSSVVFMFKFNVLTTASFPLLGTAAAKYQDPGVIPRYYSTFLQQKTASY